MDLNALLVGVLLGLLGVVILIFFGLLWLIHKSIQAIVAGFEQAVQFSMQALSQAMQALANTLHPPVAPPPLPSPPTPLPLPPPAPPTPPVSPPTPPVGQQPFPGAPTWFNWAAHEIGTKEDPNNTGAAIRRYIALAHAGVEGDPWCAIFANACLESCNITGTRSASSQSFRTNPNFVQLSGPSLGAITVFWRNSKTSGLGHVGFYRGELGGDVWVLGGNEGNMVQIEALPKDSSSFGLVGYWWPKTVPLPTSGAVVMPQGSPTHVQTPPTVLPDETGGTPPTGAVFADVTATVFGGTKDTEHSAYDGHLVGTTELGVALPFHFTGARPKVRVTNPATGASCVGDIVDVGPWYPNQGKGYPADPYWTTNSRPRAETDPGTNQAGIDLTPAMARAVGIDGKGKVNWTFVS